MAIGPRRGDAGDGGVKIMVPTRALDVGDGPAMNTSPPRMRKVPCLPAPVIKDIRVSRMVQVNYSSAGFTCHGFPGGSRVTLYRVDRDGVRTVLWTFFIAGDAVAELDAAMEFPVPLICDNALFVAEHQDYEDAEVMLALSLDHNIRVVEMGMVLKNFTSQEEWR